MTKRWGLGAVALSVALASCGGGGGGVQSAGSTSPGSGSGSGSGGTGTTPPATNTTITNLVASQTFTNDASTTLATLDTSAVTTTRASAAASTLTISYDAASKSYTVSEPGRSQTFTPADVNTDNSTTFKKSNGSGNDYLTLVTTPFETTTPNRYVGLGFWQRNQVSGTTQDTSFDLFTYGLDTPAVAVPRTGSATYAMDAFAFLNIPGKAPLTLQGTGTFDVDFQSATFAQNAFLTTFNVTTGASVTNGYLPLKTSGRLSASDGSFAGVMSFEDPSDLNKPIAGTSAGHFYGPGAEEVGVTFAGASADGATLNGGYTGQRGTGPASRTLALTDVTAAQHFYINQSPSGYEIAGLDIRPDGGVSYQPYSSGYDSVNFTSADVVAGSPNFTTYQTTVNGHQATVALYKPGAGNGELALTYASFGSWQQVGSSTSSGEVERRFFAYGLLTDPDTIAVRTGTASYAGVTFGSATDRDTATGYTLSGSEALDVNFSTHSFANSLTLKGTTSDGLTRDFGTFASAGSISGNTMAADLNQGGVKVGAMLANFYGPGAEEAAGIFSSRVGAVDMAGAVAAKRR